MASSSFQHLQSVLLRGGRITKVAGRAASFAPQLGLALFASTPLVTAGSTAAYAACTNGGLGTYQCSGTITTTQSLSPPAGLALTVTTTEQISIVTATGDALDLSNSSGDKDITFTDTYISTITGAQIGISAYNNGTGALSITTTGDVTGTNGDGIEAGSSSTGTDLTIQAVAVSGGVYGIDASNRGTGALSITATGTVDGATGDGIGADISSSGTDLTVQAAAVSGGRSGIGATNGGTGVLSITATGAVMGSMRHGIDATNRGTDTTIQVGSVGGYLSGISASGGSADGAMSITATGTVTGTTQNGIAASNGGTDLTISVATVTGNSNGISADHSGSGLLSLTATGDISGTTRDGLEIDLSSGTGGTLQVGNVTGEYAGIDVTNSSDGAVSITATGDVVGKSADGIYAYNGDGTDITIHAASVTGAESGIYANNYHGTGAISITATGDVTGQSDYGIYAYQYVYGTSVTVQAAAVTGDSMGVYVNNDGSGLVSITTTGDVIGTRRGGMGATNSSSGTDLTIQAAAVSGATYGISARNSGTGVTSIATTGDVTGTSDNGIYAANSKNGAGLTIQAANVTGGSNGILAFGHGGDLAISAATVAGGNTGIYARNYGTGALSVTTTGDVTGTNRNGIFAQGAGTDLTIQAASVAGDDNGVSAYNSGSGALSITSSGAVTAATGNGINAIQVRAGTDLTIRAASVAGGYDGINATNSGVGALSIVATGDVVGTSSSGIRGTNSSYGTDLTISAATVTGGGTGKGSAGIYADNQGSGTLSITATGAVTGGVGTGIRANNSGKDLTIQVAAVSGGQSGIYATNNGTGALSVTSTGTVTGTYRGVLARNYLGSTDLTVSVANVTSTNSHAIRANNSGSGRLSITASGSVASTNGFGISAVNSDYSTDLTIQAAAVSGGSRGISGVNYGTGTFSITTSGPVTGTSDDGIYANNSYTGTDLTIAAAAVTGGRDGINAYHQGTGDLLVEASGDVAGGRNGIYARTSSSNDTTITVSGAVTGGTGTGIQTGGGGSKDINLNAGSAVSATSGTAIKDFGGDATVRVNTGSTVTGSIELGTGSDTLILAGGDVSGVTSFDGGFTPATYVGVDTLRVAAPTDLAGGNVTNFSHLEVVDGGTLSLSDNMISIGDGSAGTGVFVRSGGTFSVPAGSTVNVTGDTVFEAGGRFQVGIASDTDVGTLSTTGALTFDTGSEVYADVTQGIQLTNQGSIEVANATNGVTDNGLSVGDNSALVDFTHEIRNGDSLFLIVEQTLSATDVTTTTTSSSNAREIAAAIDVLIDGAPADNPVVTYLAQFPVEEQAAQLLQLVEDTLPSETGASGSGTVVSTDMVLDLIMDRLSGGGFAVVDSGQRLSGVSAGEQILGGAGNWALWGRAGVSTAEFDPSGVNGFDSDTYALSLGIDGDVAENLRMGLALFYSSTDVDEIGVAANSNQEIDGYGVLFYGAYHPGDFYVNATAGFGLNEYTSRRSAAGGINTAEYDGSQFMSRVELGKVFTDGALDISPHVGLRFNQVSIDGYTETGPLPTSVNGQDLTSLRGVLGVSGRYTHGLDNGSKLIPEGYVRGLQELADPGEAITGNVVGGGSFISQTTERDKFSYAAGVGLTYEMDDQFSVRFMYDGEFQTDYQEHSLTAAIRYQF